MQRGANPGASRAPTHNVSGVDGESNEERRAKLGGGEMDR